MRTIEAEVQLLNWSETATGGSKIVLQVDDLEPWRTLRRREGKISGTRFMAVLVEIDDDEQPVRDPMGPRCQFAVFRCKEEAFRAFLSEQFKRICFDEEDAKEIICEVCGIKSRRELDSDPAAWRKFNEQIRTPWQARGEE